MSDTFTINKVYPWGRRYFEYERMFGLPADISGMRILDCGGGPSSFTAEATAKGAMVTSADPLYQFDSSEIRRRVEETRTALLANVREHQDHFCWKTIRSPEHMGELRMQAMELFLQDYESGRQQGRYINASLPKLPFDNFQFDVALVSHLLFLNLSFDLEFHLASIQELLRVAGEVRIFPLLNMGGETSEMLLPVWDYCNNRGHGISLQPVDYQVQKGGGIMLQITGVP